MITTAYLFRYRIKEFIQFTRNALMIVSQHGPDALKIKSQYQALNKHYQQLEQTYQQDKNNELARQIVELDAARDQAVVCLRTLSEGYTRHHQPALREAGQQVLTCIDQHGPRIYHLNYSAETTVLKKLVRDLQTIPACTQAIAQLGLAEVVSEMKRANQEFERQFVRHLEVSSQTEGLSTRERVQQTAEAYRTLVNHAEAHATLTPSAEYTLFMHHLNENIEHFNQIVTRRTPDNSSDTAEVIEESAQ